MYDKNIFNLHFLKYIMISIFQIIKLCYYMKRTNASQISNYNLIQYIQIMQCKSFK